MNVRTSHIFAKQNGTRLIVLGLIIFLIIQVPLQMQVNGAGQDSRNALNGPLVNVSPLEDVTSILQNPLMGFEDHSFNGQWWPWSTGYLRATASCNQNGRTV